MSSKRDIPVALTIAAPLIAAVMLIIAIIFRYVRVGTHQNRHPAFRYRRLRVHGMAIIPQSNRLQANHRIGANHGTYCAVRHQH